jgi:hypothetical protein
MAPFSAAAPPAPKGDDDQRGLRSPEQDRLERDGGADPIETGLLRTRRSYRRVL